MTETELSKQIRSALQKAGHWPIRINSGSMRVAGGFVHGAPAGTPDIHIIDLCAWIEVKLPGRGLDEKQEAWHARARALGVRVGLATSTLEALRLARSWLDEDSPKKAVLAS